MKYLGSMTDSYDLVNKGYVDEHVNLKQDKEDYLKRNILPISYDLTLWNKENNVTVSWYEREDVQMFQIYHPYNSASSESARYGVYYDIPVSPGTTYTFSVFGRQGPASATAGFNISDGTGWGTTETATLFTRQKERLTKTITTGGSTTSVRCYIWILNSATSANNYVFAALPKVEVGSTATDWNPDYMAIDATTSGKNVKFDEIVCNSLLVNGNARIVNGTLVGGVYTTAQVALSTSGWSGNSQTVSVTGVTASNLVIVTPAPNSAAAWSGSGIVCSGQAAGTLTFTYEVKPTVNVVVNVVIL